MTTRSASRARYRAARAFTVVVNVVVWVVLLGLIGNGLGGALARPEVSATALRVSIVAFALLLATIGAQGTVTALLDGFTRDRFEPPPPAEPASRNPWATGAIAAVGSLPLAAVAVALTPRGPVSADAYAAWVVATGAIAVGGASLYASGAPIAAEIAAVRAGARWTGTFAAYRLWRYALPNAALNVAANGLVAVALTPADGHAPAAVVVPDAAVATWIIATAVSFGARNVARADRRAGFVALDGTPPSRGRQALFAVAAALVGAAVAWALCLAADGLPLGAFVVTKGLWSGGLAFAAAWVAAGWGAAEADPPGGSP